MDKKQKYGPFRPNINDRKEREKAIKNNSPAVFDIKTHKFPVDVGRKSIWQLLGIGLGEEADEVYNQDNLGKSAVQKHDKAILKHSQKQGIDPDIVRSVMYAENARGHKLGVNYAADEMRKSESIMPMNLQKNRWSGLAGKNPEDMYDSDANIQASTVLLKRITDRVEKPTPEKVGTLWNTLGAEYTNDFGDYIGDVYRKKPWKKID